MYTLNRTVYVCKNPKILKHEDGCTYWAWGNCTVQGDCIQGKFKKKKMKRGPKRVKKDKTKRHPYRQD